MVSKGKPLRSLCSLRSLETQTFIAGLRCHSFTAPWIVDTLMNSRIFETRIETQLARTLSKGDVIILEKVGFHKSERA
ncbi:MULTISPECIES: hypothetical protein [unclassified Rhizobium]|uniref:hypothetical protein n=1 Tax=unclassified Rhizobium TaxID=2613769 RepID=UPI002478C62D|nr:MULTISPECIES: hypothetical protein [unclassified Rhizobium]MDH7804227.1 transposase [Rhizobium sp. AN70]